MLKYLVSVLSIIVALLITACSGPSSVPGPIETGVNYGTLKPYTIGIDDQLTVNVWRNPELSIQVPVRPDGKISIPLIGDVTAAGKEVPTLATEIEKALDKYIRSPEVTVIVTAANNAQFTSRVRITGAVQAPVSLPYRQQMTVLDLVLEAGGLTEFANGNAAKLYRKTDKGIKTYNVRLDSIMKKGDVSTNYQLLPSDLVTVPESVF